MYPQNNKAVWFVVFILLMFLVGGFAFMQYQISGLRTSIDRREDGLKVTVTATPIPYIIISPTPTPTNTASLTPTPKVVLITPIPQINAPKITYIPLTGGSTQNTDWVTVPGSGFNFNISDYGSKASVIWDANIRVDNASGQTFVRLFDTTHGITVNGSEINIIDTSSSTDVTSGGLSFWQGNNSYVVQIKSLNGSTAFMDSGRIKVTY